MFNLRNYQSNVIEKVRNEFKIGNKKILVVLPCGGGKTICFGYMALQHILKNKNNYVWFLVHRKELVEQTKAIFDNLDNIMVGMIASVGNKLEKYKKPTMIVIDECHHSTSKTYRKIIDAYPNVPLIGLTATPIRLDGTGLGEIYETLVEGVTAKWLIENKYLAPYNYYAPNINALVPKKRGFDYDKSAIEYDSIIYGRVIDYLDKDKKTIIYCPNIPFSERLALEIGGTHFDGSTPKIERERIIADFRSGKIKILLNVDLIGEGFDVPDCDCVMLLRPTLSLSLYIQQSMRCMRYVEGKIATIYDFVGNCYRHGLPDDIRAWKLGGKMRVRNSSGEPNVIVRQCASCFKVYNGNSRICPFCGVDNGLTPKEIKTLEKERLETIKEVEKFEKKKEIWNAKSFNELKEIEIKRGYKKGWAALRWSKRKKI